MRRLFFGLAVSLVAILGSAISMSPLQAKGINDFTIQRFDADYYLDKDAEGRSILKITERISTVFPEYDQNHGLERALPTKYDDHSTQLKVVSVADEKGTALEYSTHTSNDNLVVRIGNSDEYIHGLKEYVITYTQRDVTRFFENTGDDEFYWDVNGTDWQQPIGAISARIHIAPSLVSALNDRVSCYRGILGSTERCTISKENDGDGGIILSINAATIDSYENVTFAVGFIKHSFMPYQASAHEKMVAAMLMVWSVLAVISSVIAIILIIWWSVRYYRLMHRIRKGTIIPEYLPPKDASVLMSGVILGNTTSDMTAQLIDLAVRHYVKIYQTKDKTLFKAAEYELEIVKDISTLRTEEARLLQDLFGKSAGKLGSRFKLASLKNNIDIAKRLLESRKLLVNKARHDDELYMRPTQEVSRFKKWGLITMIIGVLTLSPLLIVAAICGLIFAHTLWPLTQKGADLERYVFGLRDYIKVAEIDRLKMLQSPEGAEKLDVTVSSEDPKQLVKLYERVLPYAVLFGLEKQWSQQLGAYYEQGSVQPDWYYGNTAFNAAVFSSALNSFSVTSSSYSSASSSSSGGSNGGGFSGGGGGGGGGGGW